MTSKNLYFKLMKEDLKRRLWAIALIGLVFFFQFPVAAAIQAGRMKDFADQAYVLTRYNDSVQELFSFSFGLTVFLMIIISLICGMSSFSYLYSKSKVDFYHGIPVKRELLYVVNYINGILIMAVPYCVMMVLGGIIAAVNGADSTPIWTIIVHSLGLNLVYYWLMYSTVIIAVMLTGNIVVSFLGTAVFCSVIPLGAGIVFGYFSEFFHTFLSWRFEETLQIWLRMSPLVEYIMQVITYSESGNLANIGTVAIESVYITLFLSLALAALGGWLYKKRPSDAAGKAMAFAISRPIIRIVITLISAVGMGIFFWFMQSETGWAIFGIICGGTIAHCVVEIIYHADFIKLFSYKGQLFICLGLSSLFFCTFHYDLVGYDRYLPKKEAVQEVGVFVDSLNQWVSYGRTWPQSDGSYQWESEDGEEYVFDHMKGADVETVLALAAQGIDSRNWIYENEPYPNEFIDHPNTYISVLYSLKSGRQVGRRYLISMGNSEELLAALYDSDAYKNAAYPVLTMIPEQVEEFRYKELETESRFSNWSEEEKAELLTAYQQDFRQLTIETMKREMPVALLRAVNASDLAGLSWLEKNKEDQYDYSSMSNRSYYPVYPSFAATIQILRKHGVAVGEAVKSLDVSSIYIEDATMYRITADREQRAKPISDKEEITLLKEVLHSERLLYYNALIERDSDYDVTVIYNDSGSGGNDRELDMIFLKNQVPAFVKSRLLTPWG